MNSLENKKTFVQKRKKKHDMSAIWYSLFSILIGLLLGMFLMALFGYSPFSLFSALFKGNFASGNEFSYFVSTLIWMTFVGLSMVVSFKAGLFNIGVSSQMVAGGLFGYLFAAAVNGIGRWGVLVSIILPIFAGMLIAFLIGSLKTKFGVHEVVSSIMLNWVVYWIYRFFSSSANFPQFFDSNGISISVAQNNSMRFGFAMDSPINIGLIVLIVVLPSIWFMYKYTSWGVKQKIIGESKDASIYAGINYEREVITTMLLSGALAGFAGSCFYLGTKQNLPVLSSDLPLEAFNGITIALIGFNNPIGAFFGAILVSLFENSKTYLDIYADKDIGSIIIAIILWFMAFSNYILITKPYKPLADWLNAGDGKKPNSIDKNADNKENTKDFVIAKSKGGEK